MVSSVNLQRKMVARSFVYLHLLFGTELDQPKLLLLLPDPPCFASTSDRRLNCLDTGKEVTLMLPTLRALVPVLLGW